MLIMAIFEHSLELEQALLILEREGIERRGIMVVPMDSDEQGDLSEEISTSWGQRAMGAGMATATASTVVGISQGFIREWGPLLWGLISAAGGFAAGWCIYALLHIARQDWGKRKAQKRHVAAVVVRAGEEKLGVVREILWNHHALAVGNVDGQAPEEGSAGEATTSA